MAVAVDQPLDDRASGRALRFSKMHGAGNDFVVLDLRDGAAPPDAALCRALADRHAGVGCDQILTVEPPRSAQALASYRIWNSDGSPSGQCGNGARCIAADRACGNSAIPAGGGHRRGIDRQFGGNAVGRGRCRLRRRHRRLFDRLLRHEQRALGTAGGQDRHDGGSEDKTDVPVHAASIATAG